MLLESIINFEVGQNVRYNENNHGFLKLGAYNKVMNREGVVGKVPLMKYVNEYGKICSKRSGKVWVMWDGDRSCRVVNYRNLKII